MATEPIENVLGRELAAAERALRERFRGDGSGELQEPGDIFEPPAGFEKIVNGPKVGPWGAKRQPMFRAAAPTSPVLRCRCGWVSAVEDGPLPQTVVCGGCGFRHVLAAAEEAPQPEASPHERARSGQWNAPVRYCAECGDWFFPIDSVKYTSRLCPECQPQPPSLFRKVISGLLGFACGVVLGWGIVYGLELCGVLPAGFSVLAVN